MPSPRTRQGEECGVIYAQHQDQEDLDSIASSTVLPFNLPPTFCAQSSPVADVHEPIATTNSPRANLAQTVNDNAPPLAPAERLSYKNRPPRALHLTPCTFEEYLTLGCDSDHRYELVDGLLVWCPPMADEEHGQLITFLDRILEYLPADYKPQIQHNTQRGVRIISKRSTKCEYQVDSSSALPSPDTEDSSGEQEEATSRLPSSPHPVMLIEVTSNNRRTDLGIKRNEYEQEGVKEFVVVDRQKNVKNWSPCVTVFTLNRRKKYIAKTYKGKEKVNCSFFDHFKLTAAQMLDYKFLRKFHQEEKHRKDTAECRAEQAECRAEQAECKAEQAECRAEQAEREIEDLKRQLKYARHKNGNVTKANVLTDDEGNDSGESAKRKRITSRRARPPTRLTISMRNLGDSGTGSPKSPASLPHKTMKRRVVEVGSPSVRKKRNSLQPRTGRRNTCRQASGKE
ncbi:unnamed protein product [Chondrus crispus]|uniref:Putative restriction endonuclease domain-containing protein n=1 Tax=Chondrus crispus TaxID=2769 RepID=R7Q978_CHOCR|nr:unnamed protein product [Chondrus crispus]CDF35082.1 unnamed protein product [Chondrus crispus]|eukprot:XP_005714901.1 unnamed protein product [Chondrus crispus]